MRKDSPLLRRNPPALASIRALDLSFDLTSESLASGDDPHDAKWRLGGEGAEVLRQLLPQLKNLAHLVLNGESRTFGRHSASQTDAALAAFNFQIGTPPLPLRFDGMRPPQS